jgi:hypothetical protein
MKISTDTNIKPHYERILKTIEEFRDCFEQPEEKKDN